jgi:hypothetical protein
MNRGHKIVLAVNCLIGGEEIVQWKLKTYSEEESIYFFNLTIGAAN